MNTILKIKGMHCESCKKLIQMELEEAGFIDKFKEATLLENQIGEIKLVNINTNDLEQIKEIINNLPNYEVIN